MCRYIPFSNSGLRMKIKVELQPLSLDGSIPARTELEAMSVRRGGRKGSGRLLESAEVVDGPRAHARNDARHPLGNRQPRRETPPGPPKGATATIPDHFACANSTPSRRPQGSDAGRPTILALLLILTNAPRGIGARRWRRAFGEAQVESSRHRYGSVPLPPRCPKRSARRLRFEVGHRLRKVGGDPEAPRHSR